MKRCIAHWCRVLSAVLACLGCTEEGARPTSCDTTCSGRGRLHGDHCDCDPGYIARGLCCLPPPPCQGPDDPFEDNDTVASATPITGGMLLHRGLRVCPGDADVFRIPLEAGQRVEVALTFTHARGDLDVYLYAPGVVDVAHARPVAASDGQRDNERFVYTAMESGDHVALVQGFEGAQNTYDLSVRVLTP